MGGLSYRDGYMFGQHDALNWLQRGDDGDAPLAPIDECVQPRAWAWCIAHNLSVAAGLCEAWLRGFQSAVLVHSPARQFDYWRPGCGRSAP